MGWMPKFQPNPMIPMEFPSTVFNSTDGEGGEIGEFHFPGRNMEATNARSHKVHLYRSGSWSSAARVSFGIISSSSFSSLYQPPPIGLHKQKKKKKKKEVLQRVSSFEWVMIRRNLNLSLKRFGGVDNKGIPEQLLLLLRDPTQRQQQQHHHHHHPLGCVGEESSSGMGDEDMKLKKQEDGSIEEKKIKGEEEEKEVEEEEKDLVTPLTSASLPAPPSPPEKPLPGDCCGNGCIPCVWDTYNEQLEDYNNLLKAYNSQSKP